MDWFCFFFLIWPFANLGGYYYKSHAQSPLPVPFSGEIRQLVVRFARVDSKAIGLVKGLVY